MAAATPFEMSHDRNREAMYPTAPTIGITRLRRFNPIISFNPYYINPTVSSLKIPIPFNSTIVPRKRTIVNAWDK